MSGLEWSVGIPGTVGGAVVMNAGAQGGCIAESLIDTTVLDPSSGQTRRLSCNELDYDYRHSSLQSEPLVVLSARFRLQAGPASSALAPAAISTSAPAPSRINFPAAAVFSATPNRKKQGG